MIPSRRCYLLLIIGGANSFLLAALFNQEVSFSFLYLYNFVLFGLTLADVSQVKANAVAVKRYPINKLSVGRDNLMRLAVSSFNHKASIEIKDYYPPQFAVSVDTVRARLPANTTKELTYTINPDRRGKYEWGDIQVRQLGNWGLAWRDWKIPAKEKVLIYPDLVGLRSLSIRLSLENTGAMRQARRLSNGTEFTELREYNRGDDLRLIDWKATARRSHPVVRVLEPEQEQTLFILLDRGRLMTARVRGLKRFDWGLNATLSLALAGLSRGDKVGVAVFDRDINTWIPPQGGNHHLAKLIERLTPLQPILLEPDYLGAITQVVSQQNRRALVVVITDLVDVTASAELLTAMVRLTPRYLPFCVTLRDPIIDTISHNSTNNTTETYSRAIALDLLAQRQVAFAKLKQRGVLVLDAPADRISEQLVTRYLQVKARNLL